MLHTSLKNKHKRSKQKVTIKNKIKESNLEIKFQQLCGKEFLSLQEKVIFFAVPRVHMNKSVMQPN